jgi:DNA-binding PadR family transcriptional regulator
MVSREPALTQTAAVRLAALGLLQGAPRRYDEVTVEVRHFASRILGPSLDILGHSIELLRAEGLIESVGPRGGPGQSLRGESLVALTDSGRRELQALLAAPIRGPMTDATKLLVALKLRFFALMPAEEQRRQLEMLIDLTQSEIARLGDLRQSADAEALADWLAQDIAQAEQRLAWYRERLARVGAPADRA